VLGGHKQDPSNRTLEPESDHQAEAENAADSIERQREIGGPSEPEPTRYGDWERAGRCIDF
jgi:hypothetical protein